MEDKLLLNISIGMSVIGLIALFITLNLVEMSATKISDIGQEQIGKTVKVIGNITSVSETKGGTVFLKINDGNEISVVAFKNLKLNMTELEKGKQVEVKGTVDEYEKEIEILAKEVKILKD